MCLFSGKELDFAQPLTVFFAPGAVWAQSKICSLVLCKRCWSEGIDFEV